MTGQVDEVAREVSLMVAPRLHFGRAVELTHSAIGADAAAEQR
jgi:hypothetical protein